jgi:hypothetical protein
MIFFTISGILFWLIFGTYYIYRCIKFYLKPKI